MKAKEFMDMCHSQEHGTFSGNSTNMKCEFSETTLRRAPDGSVLVEIENDDLGIEVHGMPGHARYDNKYNELYLEDLDVDLKF